MVQVTTVLLWDGTQGAEEASAMQIALVDRWEKLRAAGGPFSTPSHPDGNLP